MITLVPGNWTGTLNVVEKVPLADDMVVVMVEESPKWIVTKLFLTKEEPLTVTSTPARPEEGETEILEDMIKNVVVTRFPEMSWIVMTLVPED